MPAVNMIASAAAADSSALTAMPTPLQAEPGDLWTASEHERFTEALQLYQSDWERVALHVGKSVPPCQAREGCHGVLSRAHPRCTRKTASQARIHSQT